jgi:hypothetical protein
MLRWETPEHLKYSYQQAFIQSSVIDQLLQEAEAEFAEISYFS